MSSNTTKPPRFEITGDDVTANQAINLNPNMQPQPAVDLSKTVVTKEDIVKLKEAFTRKV